MDDVIEQQNAQNLSHLRELAQHEHFFNLSLDLLCIATTDGYFKRVNPAFERILGYTAKELLSQPFLKLVHPEDVESTIEELSKLKSGIDTIHFENRYRCKDGSWRWISWRCPAAEVNTGLLYAIGRDVTISKQNELSLLLSEEKLNQQAESLEQKNAALKEILEQITIEKQQIKDDVIENIDKLIMPLLNKIKMKSNSKKYIYLLKKNLENITSSFGRQISLNDFNLTSREIEICNMIHQGQTNKEIASLLNISIHTVEKHRLHIREKLGIANQNVNLTTYLRRI